MAYDNYVHHRGKGVQLVQKKKTIYPEWNTCFDAHLYEGRVIELAVWKRPETYVSDVSITAQALAEKFGFEASGTFTCSSQIVYGARR
ncbi:hypothetical protein LSH36_487g03014 [Paralvinella palmiformis]|uniref:Uncharacterized protein n=1 Tax=Paralvinella palmiformis TaxID=53620 RepID=A0AAD9JAH6_9ANNE|nr:hypothetical protein LSH36_487g03014 [Paralvinella palmiformis]